jgi:hypothetical protein
MSKAESRIALFYPWTGLPALDRGAARRVVPLVRLLGEHYDQVRVISPGKSSGSLSIGNVEYYFQQPSAVERLCLQMAFVIFDGAFHRLFGRRVNARERRQWWHYLSSDIQWSLARQIRRTVSWASAVLLEYPFWGRAVLASCRRTKKKSLLTMHDILSELVVHSAWLRRKVRSRELFAARTASCVFCVSESDRQYFSKRGVVARFVSHGIDTEPRKSDPVPESPHMQQVVAAQEMGKTVCLFVGSSLQANLEAVNEIRGIAAALAPGGNFQFVIAGACLPRGTYEHHVIAFGPVEEALLEKLYEATDIVLAPLRAGTGTSLKVLEAFVHERALVGTSTALRGYPVHDGSECVICDDTQKYPEILVALRADPIRRRALAQAARLFVNAYDYRIVYRPYLECIDAFLG